ncbi:MAG: D-tagatose 3-epimerase [Planctomycetes bacterium ADurb.Bin412]|nr:MAG: D-tagatose 3-epimerase [Planctomycetes bacterium ADurb.Bin412]
MKIGFNLLLWATHITKEHYRILEKLKAVGYDSVEVPLFEGDVPHYRQLAGVLKSNGLACNCTLVIPDEEHNPISPDPARRAGALDFFKWGIDRAQALNAEVVAGPFHQPLGVFSGSSPTEQEKAWAVEVHRRASDLAGQAGITLAVEFLNRFECYFLNTMNDAAAYARRVNHPSFGVLYDTFHANIEEKDPVGVIAPNIDTIKYVHISENDRGTPGTGHIDWRGTFKALRSAGYDGCLTIEAFSRALPGLAAATRVWRDFFTSQEDVYTQGYKFIRQQWDQAK